MTEPVAWRYKNVNQKVWCVSHIKPDDRAWGIIEPLYTSDQLHQRVKMTQAEFNEFCLLYKKLSNSTAMGILNTVIYNESQEFGNLQSLIFKVGEDFKILSLFDKFDIDNPEETIEIVPEMKWFVRSKEKYAADIVQGLPESGYLYLTDGGSYSIEYCEMTTFKDDATQFDAKEEAKKWCNPLTEAVQLPVEDEND